MLVRPPSVSFAPLARACPVCGDAHTEAFEAREKMFGTGEAFRYGACGGCGILWLLDPPDDLGAHYPPTYYSFQRPVKVAGPLRRAAKTVWARHHLERPSALGALLATRFPRPPFFEWIERAGASRQSRILDVGCGRGHLLHEMAGCGFSNLTGTDPFLAADEAGPDGVRLLRRSLEEIEGTFDLVMAHHAFEHMPAPEAHLRQMARLVAPGGTVLLRIPVADSWAWQHYGLDWVALDAPRHLFLHTNASIERLAAAAGLAVAEIVNDAGAMTCWASEQYRQGIALEDPRSYGRNPAASPFTPADLAAFAETAAQMNAQGRGDTRAYYLRRR